MTHSIDKPIPHLAVLLLAAGESARFGGRKQLADIDGKPMLRHAIDTLSPLSPSGLCVVLGAFHDEIAPETDPAHNIILNENWASGMGSSIAAGMAEIARHGAFDGVLIALCDQVRLCTADYQKLITQFDSSTIVATRYDGGYGVPAIFPADLFKTLETLSGQQGARKILNGPDHDVIGVDLPNAVHDIDTQNDLNALSPSSS